VVKEFGLELADILFSGFWVNTQFFSHFQIALPVELGRKLFKDFWVCPFSNFFFQI